MSSFLMREGDIIFVAFCVAVETEAGGEMKGEMVRSGQLCLGSGY